MYQAVGPGREEVGIVGRLALSPNQPKVCNVEARLIDAFRVLRSVHVEGLWPQGHKVIWPPYFYTFEDKVAQAELGELENDPPERVIVYGPERIQQMEEAIAWPMMFLRDEPGPAQRLVVYCKARAIGYSFSREMRRRGWNRDTTYRWVRRALETIAQGLER